MTASHLILLQCLSGAALTDLLDRRIPNLLIGTYLLLGMFLNFRCIEYFEEYHHITLFLPLSFLFRFFLTSLVLSVFTVLTHAGAGDAKLLALILSWTGFYNGLNLLLPGLILALAFLLIRKVWTETADTGHKININTPICNSMPMSKPRRYISPNISLPLAVPVFLGAIPGLIFNFP